MVQEQPKVTAVLITYKRHENLARVVQSLLRWDFIDEIIIRNHEAGDNEICWGRYLSAKQAKNNFIYTQDDDAIVDNVDEIYQMFFTDTSTVCHAGTEEYQQVIKDNVYGDHQMAMFGWGAIFDRRWIGVLDQYLDKFGNDYCFRRETDRIFTMLLRKRHNFVLGKITHLEGARSEEALSSKDDHVSYKNLAIERCKSLL